MCKQAKELADLIRRHRAVFEAASRAEDTAAKLVRAAKALRRIAERQCSEEMDDAETARVEKREAALEKTVRDLCAPLDIRPTFDGDPRGFVVKLHFGPDPKRQPGNTWGGTETGWGIG